jgi:hypothetical protein
MAATATRLPVPATAARLLPRPATAKPPRNDKIKGVPIWAWALGGFVVILIIAGIIGATNKPATSALTPTAVAAAQASPTSNGLFSATTAPASKTTVAAANARPTATAKPTVTPQPTIAPQVATAEWGVIRKDSPVFKTASVTSGATERLKPNTLVAFEKKLADNSWFMRAGGGWVSGDNLDVFPTKEEAQANLLPEPTATPAPTPVPLPGINQVVSVKNWDLKVLSTQKPGKALVWSEFGNQSDAAGTWLVIPIELKNTGNTNFGVNTFDFELKDGKGITYKYSTDVGASYGYSKYKGGQDVGGQVPPGVTVKYFLVFDIAPDATGLKLVFRQDKNPQINLGI